MTFLALPRRRSFALLKAARGLTVALATLAALPEALAQGNYQGAFLGGRSALMGGTGVALGVDGAAPYLNPANITRIEDMNVAFSSRFFSYSQRSFDGLHMPGSPDAELFGDVRVDTPTHTQRDLTVVPDATCFFLDSGRRKGQGRRAESEAGNRKIAWCIGKTEDNTFSLDSLVFSGISGGQRINQAQSMNRTWTSWSGGPAFAVNVTDEIAVGGALFVSRSLHSNIVAVSTVVGRGGPAGPLGSVYQSAVSGSSWDMLAHLGVRYRLSETFSAGLSVRTPSIHLASDFSASYTDVLDGASGSLRYWAGEGALVVKSPLRIAVGLGAEWRRLRLELDGFLYTGLDERARADVDREDITLEGGIVSRRARGPMSLRQEAAPVANLGLGAEVFVTETLSVIGGALTDFSALTAPPRADPYAARLFHDRMDALRTGLGVVSYTDYGDLVIGLRADFGWGEMGAVNAFVSPARIEAVDYRSIEIVAVLAGRLSLRTVKEAAQDIGEAVEGKAKTKVPKPKEPMSAPRKKE